MVQAGGGSVIVWGVFTWFALGPLVHVQVKLYGNRYKTLLGDHLQPFMDFSFLDNSGMFQHDNVPSHRTADVQDWFVSMNPIKHLWDVVERAIHIQDPAPRNTRELWAAIETACLNVSQEVFCPLVESMPCQVTALLRARGTLHVIRRVFHDLHHVLIGDILPKTFERMSQSIRTVVRSSLWMVLAAFPLAAHIRLPRRHFADSWSCLPDLIYITRHSSWHQLTSNCPCGNIALVPRGTTELPAGVAQPDRDCDRSGSYNSGPPVTSFGKDFLEGGCPGNGRGDNLLVQGPGSKRRERGRQSMLVRSVREWNVLWEELVSVRGVGKFRKGIGRGVWSGKGDERARHWAVA
ncbi:hypothetical protein PR048_026546 [Dryococelus australis]|uniref:Transposase n=1 Tax=Dryococelus australis TaxID=614101 RepID=A0ABQ9GLP0_9NEOP|nr:hypothetical protein PR048_026546 [Dryococelus australis]